jgi:methylated-DNA-[protein]-cysteine S-methyltransferase
MSNLRFHIFETDLGWVGVAFSDSGLREITLPHKSRDDAFRKMTELGTDEPATEAEARSASALLNALARGQPHANGLPLDWSGITPFRREVMEECMRIPAGQTLTYGELAAKVGRPRSARAVGRVMATNPFPLLVPCHRVLGSDGTLHGYGGGLPMKAALLKAEGKPVKPGLENLPNAARMGKGLKRPQVAAVLKAEGASVSGGRGC